MNTRDSVETLTRWRDFLVSARATMAAERLQIKSPIRDRQLKQRADDLEWSIKLVDRGSAPLRVVTLLHTRIGELMAAAGYSTEGRELHGPNGWQGSLPEVERRLRTLTAQRATAGAAP